MADFNEDGDVQLPASMTEEEVLEIVRELIGDEDMTDEELCTAYKSGMFLELCPDIESYAKQRAGRNASGGDKDKVPKEQVKMKRMRDDSEDRDVQPGSSRPKSNDHQNDHKVVKVKTEYMSDSDDSRHVSKHKKKKKKHSKDHKTEKREKTDRYREERKENTKSTDSNDRVKHKEIKKELSSSDSEKERKRREEKLRRQQNEVKIVKPKEIKKEVISSDSEDDQRQRKEKPKKHSKKRRTVYISSSSDSSDSGKKRKRQGEEPKSSGKEIEDSSKKDTSTRKTERDEKPKIHPYYQEQVLTAAGTGQAFQKSHKENEGERTIEKKNEPKPVTKYNTSASNTNFNRWKPFFHRDHLRYQRRFRLKPISVICVDLLDMPLAFYDPDLRAPNPNSLPLTDHVAVSGNRRELIKRLEREKTATFRKKLNRKALKVLKLYKGTTKRKYSSDEDKRHKRAKIMDRIVSSASSNSDSSSIMTPIRKTDTKDNRFQKRGKLTKAEREQEARKRKIEEIKKKGDKLSARGTRILPWENKDKYFNKTSKKADDAAKEKEKAIAEKKKRVEMRKMERLKHAPTVKFQSILAQIDAANKQESLKPKVDLKIPKIGQNTARIPTEYKCDKDGRIGVGDVAKEVARLLCSNTNVECPVMPEDFNLIGGYTVKKIAWWLLKNEKDPPDVGVFHPELHDNDGWESDHEDDFDWPSDTSSINGCVSDPEGLASEMPPDPTKINDPDWADDYCGAASLYARIRRLELAPPTTSGRISLKDMESVDHFKAFMRIKPGTNYEKHNFEAKCFICNGLVSGQRQLGAHIRSDSHKDTFRNFSLNLANYPEEMVKAVPKKEFLAKLVAYSAETPNAPSRPDMSEDTKLDVRNIEPVRSDSPRPLIGGEGAVQVCEMPMPDDISLPSIENFDISSDESLQNVRVAIRTKNKWDESLERRWRQWNDEEMKIAEQYNSEREFFINEPERHPNYQVEWLKFWDQRSTELEAEGKDADNYDYQKEWMPFWLKRMQEIMKQQVEEKVANLKRHLGIDKHTLRKCFGISHEATKSTKTKKQEAVNSSLKSSSKGTSSETQNKVQKQSISVKAYHHNSKRSLPPTPPGTSDEGRRVREDLNISLKSNQAQLIAAPFGPTNKTKPISAEKLIKSNLKSPENVWSPNYDDSTSVPCEDNKTPDILESIDRGPYDSSRSLKNFNSPFNEIKPAEEVSGNNNRHIYENHTTTCNSQPNYTQDGNYGAGFQNWDMINFPENSRPGCSSAFNRLQEDKFKERRDSRSELKPAENIRSESASKFSRSDEKIRDRRDSRDDYKPTENIRSSDNSKFSRSDDKVRKRRDSRDDYKCSENIRSESNSKFSRSDHKSSERRDSHDGYKASETKHFDSKSKYSRSHQDKVRERRDSRDEYKDRKHAESYKSKDRYDDRDNHKSSEYSRSHNNSKYSRSDEDKSRERYDRDRHKPSETHTRRKEERTGGNVNVDSHDSRNAVDLSGSVNIVNISKTDELRSAETVDNNGDNQISCLETAHSKKSRKEDGELSDGELDEVSDGSSNSLMNGVGHSNKKPILHRREGSVYSTVSS